MELFKDILRYTIMIGMPTMLAVVFWLIGRAQTEMTDYLTSHESDDPPEKQENTGENKKAQ